MRRLRSTLFLALVTLSIVAPPTVTIAQQPPSTARVFAPPAAGRIQRVKLKDGSELVGKIVAADSTTVTFESALGVIALSVASIESVREEVPGKVRQGQYYFANPNDTRLVFAPTGRMLNTGEGYFSDYWIFFPGIAVGVSDQFTLGGGVSIIPEISIEDQVWYFTPKVGIVKSPSVNLAVGALVASVPGDEDDNTAGILYGVGTFGEPDASFTVGFGYGFVNGELADRPVAMFGGEVRAAPRVSFVSENYFFPGGSTALSAGVRFMGRDLSVDLAMASISGGDGDSFCCLPFVGFVWKWR